MSFRFSIMFFIILNTQCIYLWGCCGWTLCSRWRAEKEALALAYGSKMISKEVVFANRIQNIPSQTLPFCSMVFLIHCSPWLYSLVTYVSFHIIFFGTQLFYALPTILIYKSLCIFTPKIKAKKILQKAGKNCRST